MSASDDVSLYIGKRQMVRPDGSSFWDFLERERIEYKKSDFPFLTGHEIPRVKPVFSFAEYLELQSRGEALAYLYNGLGETWTYVGPVLDTELKHGFNDHTDRHTLWVSQTGVELLQRAGESYCGEGYFDEESEVLMTLVGMTHDLGNFMARKDHPQYSAWLLTRLFEDTKVDEKAWEAVLRAVLFHDEHMMERTGFALESGFPLVWGLVAADKMHLGRDRIGSRSTQREVASEAMEADVYILLETMIARSSWVLEAGSFVWHLDFSIDLLQERFENFSNGNDRLWLPEWVYSKFLKGTMYRETFANEFLKLYGKRIEMLQQSVFELFPFVVDFKIVLADTDTRGKVGSGRMEIYKEGRAPWD